MVDSGSRYQEVTGQCWTQAGGVRRCGVMVDSDCRSQEVTGDGGHRLQESGGDG